MQPNHAELVVVCRGRSERECAELSLVLTARGIAHRRLPGEHGEWLLAVAARDAREAADEVEAYRAEHAAPPPPPPALGNFPGAWIGVAGYAAVLMLFAILTEQAVLGVDWRRAGLLDAGAVFAGEWWRAATALTLHADTGHLASNLVFGGFFGFFLGRYFGPGAAWLAILGSGIAGNLLNALIQSPDHRSLGASTAVFGALGLLTAHAWRRGPGTGSWRARVAPIAAGIGLLAFTGTGGENTDIFAHLTGFVAGFGTGAVLSHVELERLRRLQRWLGGAAFATLALVWWLALMV